MLDPVSSYEVRIYVGFDTALFGFYPLGLSKIVPFFFYLGDSKFLGTFKLRELVLDLAIDRISYDGAMLIGKHCELELLLVMILIEDISLVPGHGARVFVLIAGTNRLT